MNGASNPPTVTVIKNDHTGQEVWRYEGVILERSATRIVLEASFDRDDMDLGYVTFRRGDRFVEYFYSDRWYNIFEVHERDSGRLKGWYCNFSRPAEFNTAAIRADDLALDLFVHPDGQMLVLDREEFERLALDDRERQAVLDALDELCRQVEARQAPFTVARG